MSDDNFTEPSLVTRPDLEGAKKDYLIRLAKYLHLKVENKMSRSQIANLIYWRITR